MLSQNVLNSQEVPFWGQKTLNIDKLLNLAKIEEVSVIKILPYPVGFRAIHLGNFMGTCLDYSAINFFTPLVNPVFLPPKTFKI